MSQARRIDMIPQRGKGKWLIALTGVAIPALLLSLQTFSIGSNHALSPIPSGHAKLVAVNQLPSEEGAMCEWMPASAQGGSLYLASLLRQQNSPAAATGSKDFASLKPIRTIRDEYAAFSAVAVDPINNEVVMTDENLFQILVYDRTTNTPASARMSEPKRVLAGLKTKIEFQCGLYIDPRDGSIYAVNNDTVDTLVIFDRRAKGDVAPTREVGTPHGTFGIAVDEATEEMYLTLQHDSALVVFRKYAEKEEAPLRLLQGDKTGLADPHGIALDTKNKLIFISNHGAVSSRRPLAAGEKAERANWPLERAQAVPGSGRTLPPSIVVHNMNAKGDVAPLRKIEGPKTRLNWPTSLAVDAERGELFVANDMDNSILIFDVNANGDVAPKRMIRGPKTGLGNPTGVWVDKKNNEVWAANFMNHSATVYPLDASGDVAPKRVIRSGPTDIPALGIGNPHPVAYDTKREQILVPNCVAHPQIAVFSRTAEVGAKPVRKIEGQASRLGRTMHGLAYDELHDEIVVPQQFSQAIMTFAGGADGEVPPIRIIQGSLTKLEAPDRLALDAVHNEIFVPEGKLLVYSRTANGNVAPIRVIEGPDTGLNASAVAVDPLNNLVITTAGGGFGSGARGTKFVVFDRTANGNVKPKLVITGPRSLGGPFSIYPEKKLIIATNRPVGEDLAGDDSYLGIWSYAEGGDHPPLWRIGGPKGILQMPRGTTLDVKNKSIIMSDKRLNAVLTFFFPEMFN